MPANFRGAALGHRRETFGLHMQLGMLKILDKHMSRKARPEPGQRFGWRCRGTEVVPLFTVIQNAAHILDKCPGPEFLRKNKHNKSATTKTRN